MNATLLTEPKLLGLFELDSAGTVLYSRIESEGRPAGAEPDVSGRNFYDEVLPFENVEEFRHRVVQFTQGSDPAGNFNFDCRYGGSTVCVRVLLARISEWAGVTRTKSVLVYIREGARFSEGKS